MDYLSQDTVDLPKRFELIRSIPCFADFTSTEVKELAALMQIVHYSPQEIIVVENEAVDSVYFIVKGQAEVTREIKKIRKIIHVPVATLNAGESIGLNDTGFYSSTANRTATVTAITDFLTLRLDLKDLYEFLKKNKLETSMYAASQQMLRMRFIKQSLPFSRLSPSRLQWLADKVEEETISAGQIIFEEGDKGDKCYLISSGLVEILREDDEGNEKRIALLKPPVLFGEATLITQENRNATARTVEDSNLLILRHEYLSELIESEDKVASVFMNLMLDRSRPIQNPNVTLHQRIAADGEEITILKNLDNRSYFKLSKEGKFIWEQLDGKHTLQDITLKLAEKYDVFAPDVVAGLISKLAKAKYVANLEMYDSGLSGSFLFNIFTKIRSLAEMRKAFGDADPWLSRVYQKYISYLFSKPAQLILAFIIMMGFFEFVFNTSNVILFFGFKHASLLLLLGLIPLSLVEVILHELGHAFAVKAFGREVHIFGVGWFWVAPVAFTDTSDMWLANRRERLLVNLAGIYVDVLVAGISAIGMFFTENYYALGMLWLFSLYTYLSAFRNLSPLQEMDGYYALMDWVEKNHLRQAAVKWLVNDFPKAIRHPSLFRQHIAESIYWLACLIYIILISMFTLIVQLFIFDIFGVQTSNPYMTLALPIIVAIISSLGIIADIRKAEE